MSSAAPGGPSAPVEKKGLSKIVSRMKTVLKRGDGSKRLSFSGKPKTTAAGPSVPVVVKPVAEPVPERKIPEGATKIMRSSVDAERALKLGERFSLKLEPLPSKPDKEAYRIERPIRLRIHRSCHQCETTFGGNKTCTQCGHTKCKDCPRYPAKKVGEKKVKGKEPAAAMGGQVGGIEADTYYGLREQLQLTKPSPRPGCQPLVRKKPKQRVRRTCHKCSILFPPGSKICPGCEHVRCADCPRDPPKKKKYPDGYPGDAPSSDITIPVKYACHKCNKVFPGVPHPSSPEGIALANSNPDPLECVRCKHPRCSECARAKPQKIEEPAPDPEISKRVEARLAALSIAT